MNEKEVKEIIEGLYAHQVRTLGSYVGIKLKEHPDTKPRPHEVRILMGALRSARQLLEAAKGNS